MISKSLADNKVFIALVVVIGLMGAWILKLGSDLVEARSRIPPIVVAPTVTLKSPADSDR